jgi:uncharacterized protein YbjT (DUF2867 family)
VRVAWRPRLRFLRNRSRAQIANQRPRAKIAHEKLIKESSISYSIVQATQFFEFVKSIADAATDGNRVRVAPVLIQAMAADDVAGAVGRGRGRRASEWLR